MKTKYGAIQFPLIISVIAEINKKKENGNLKERESQEKDRAMINTKNCMLISVLTVEKQEENREEEKG